MKPIYFLVLASLLTIPAATHAQLRVWITRGDQSALLQEVKQQPLYNNTAQTVAISIDTTRKFQKVDGFGFALTGSSALLISKMEPSSRSALLRELFTTNGSGIGISMLRISIGSSDLSPDTYFYDDVPPGQTDPDLQHFSLGKDEAVLLPVLKEIQKIAPNVRYIATPWSAPIWMKTNASSIGGTLREDCYKVYADYFVKYIQTMQKAGISIDALSPQNEPKNEHNNPSMVLSASQELKLVRDFLAPALRTSGLKTKIIIYDHNCDDIGYATSILNDKFARAAVIGTAFHLYAGDINAMGNLHDRFPDKNVYFTEQYTDAKGNFGGDLHWHVKNLIIGAMRNWSRNVIEWNLASDPSFGPHTTGGCSTCKGALTISGNTVTRNVSYYVIAHASRFVPPGSVRVWSDQTRGINTVAFLTPERKTILITENEADTDLPITINSQTGSGKWVIPAGSVSTFVW